MPRDSVLHRIIPKRFPHALRPYFFLAGVVALFLAFGLYHIGSFITADEHYWVEERIPQYWNAWADGKLKKTFINDKPGVSLALVSGIALPFFDETVPSCQYEEGRFRACDPGETATLYRAFRLPILFANALLLVALFFSVRAFTNLFTANATVFFTAFSPHLLGMSQIVNPDSLLWSTGAVVIFSFLAFLKSGHYRFAFLAAATLALSLLSKYTALIILFFLPVIVLILYFADRKFSPLPIARQTLALLSVSAVAVATFSAFAPGLFLFDDARVRFIAYFTASTGSIFPWLAYTFLILLLLTLAFIRIPARLTILAGASASWFLRVSAILFLAAVATLVIGRFALPSWPIFDVVPNDIKDLTNARYYLSRFLTPFEIGMVELSALIYALPLASLALSLLAIGKSAASFKKPFQALPLILVLFIALNLVVLGISNVFAVSRYVILLFPLVAFLAALGLSEVLELVPKRFPRIPFTGRTVALAGIGLVSFGSLLSATPYYANFANTLLPQAAVQNHSWGYGGYEAARYLNALPSAKHLTVWSDYYGVCEYFVGRCLTSFDFDPVAIEPDYYVLTRRGRHRYSPRADRWEERSGLVAHRYYDRTDADWQIAINGNEANFVKIFKTDTTLRAAIITDIDHCVSRAPVPDELFALFRASANKHRPDFTVSLGDNISHRLQSCSRTAGTDLPYVVSELKKTNSPRHVFVLGDHDLASSTQSYQFWLTQTGRTDTYYSFDTKSIHVVVLDTITGGEPLVKTCPENPACAQALAEKNRLDALIRDRNALAAHLRATGKTRATILMERQAATAHYETELAMNKSVRDAADRDRGMILERELAWLKADLASARPKKTLVLSDHPLIQFSSDRKGYDILNGDQVRTVLEQSGKETIAISGEAHLWYEEERNGVRYFIIDQFRANGGSWGLISWGKDGFSLEKHTTTPATQ